MSSKNRYKFEDEPWRANAECFGSPDVFFAPVGTEGYEAKLARETVAKKFCGHCVVRAECLEYAITTNREDGIWGGLTEAERRHLLKSTDKSMAK